MKKKSGLIQLLNRLLKFIISIPSRIMKFINEKIIKMKKDGKTNDEISKEIKKMKAAKEQMDELAKSASKLVDSVKENLTKSSGDDVTSKQREAVNKCVNVTQKMSEKLERMTGEEFVEDYNVIDFEKVKREAIDGEWRTA